MKIVKLAETCGVVFKRCDPTWGGTWAYSVDLHTTFNGYATKEDAAENWLDDFLYGDEKLAEIVKKAIEAYKEEE